MSGAVLAIDQGTSATKALVVDASGQVLAAREMPVNVDHGSGGRVEVDPEAVLSSVLAAGRGVLEAAGVPISCCAVANQGETVLAWDLRDGRPLTPAIVWQDRRAEAVCHDLAHLATDVANRTGLVLDPYFSAPKMAWLRRTLTRDGVVTTLDSWLLHRLTGAFVTDVSTASRSAVLDLDSLDWDRDLLAGFGLADEVLPDLLDTDAVVGETGAFGSIVPVAGIGVDQAAALYGEGCLEAGTAKCTIGTGAFLLANTGAHPLRSRSGLTASVAWQLRSGRRHYLDGQVYAAGTVLHWLVGLGLLREASDVDQVAASDPKSALCVPALSGLAAPWWRPNAQASFVGLGPDIGRGELVLAAVQGIAAQIAELVDVLAADTGRTLEVLRVDGGLTRSRVLMQAVADLTGVTVEIFPSEHATALGVAAFGWLALDSETTAPPAAAGKVVEPDLAGDRVAEFRARWRRVADTLQAGEDS